MYAWRFSGVQPETELCRISITPWNLKLNGAAFRILYNEWCTARLKEECHDGAPRRRYVQRCHVWREFVEFALEFRMPRGEFLEASAGNAMRFIHSDQP